MVALIPAHNEERDIATTIRSVQCQTVRPNVIIVIADNCDDGTASIARTCGAVVVETVGNTAKKAGALNQGLRYCLKRYRLTTFVLQMDADTTLDEHFVERTLRSMRSNPRIGGLGASFVGRPTAANGLWNKFLVWSQRLEFERFHNSQLTHQTSVLSGTASLLRIAALREVFDSEGWVWDEQSIVEDYKLTKILQKRGWLCMTDSSFVAHTDVMASWPALFRQRLRWQSGTLGVVFDDFRGEPCVRLDAWRQRFTYFMVIPHVLGYILLTTTWVLYGLPVLPLLITWGVLSLYEAWKAHRLGWRSTLFAATILPLEFYNFVRYVWLVRSWKLYRRSLGTMEW